MNSKKLLSSGVIQKLQRLTEMDEFINFIKNNSKISINIKRLLEISLLGNFNSRYPLEALVNKWQKRFPDTKLDPIPHWDDIITNRYMRSRLYMWICQFTLLYRTMMLKKISAKFDSSIFSQK